MRTSCLSSWHLQAQSVIHTAAAIRTKGSLSLGSSNSRSVSRLNDKPSWKTEDGDGDGRSLDKCWKTLPTLLHGTGALQVVRRWWMRSSMSLSP